MARRRHRVEDSPRASGYIPPASPTRPPTSHVYLSRGDRLYTEAFVQDEYAAAFIAAALEGEGEYKWLKNNVGRLEIFTESGMKVRASDTDELERLIELTDTDLPEVPMIMMRQLAAFKEDRGMRAQRADGTEIEPKPPREKRTRAPKGEKQERAPKKEKPAGFKGVPELCAATGKEGTEIRPILRKHVPKPDIGWLWDEKTFADVLKVVKRELG